MSRNTTDKQYPKTFTATIASSGTTSAEVDLQDFTLVGFIMPASFTGTSVTFTMSDASGGTYVTVQDGDGADLVLPIAVSKFIPINNIAFTTGIRYIKIVSNGTESSSRSIKLVARRV